MASDDDRNRRVVQMLKIVMRNHSFKIRGCEMCSQRMRKIRKLIFEDDAIQEKKENA